MGDPPDRSWYRLDLLVVRHGVFRSRYSVGEEIRWLRQKLGPVPREITRSLEKRYSLLRPIWLSADHPLARGYQDWQFVVRNGQVVWAHVVEAEEAMYRRGFEAHAVSVVYSQDPYYDDRVVSLGDVARLLEARRAFGLNENDLSQFEVLPRSIAGDFTVQFARLVVHCDQLPLNRLVFKWFPIFVAPESTPAVLMISPKLWSRKYRQYWNHKAQ